ncbi:MAG: EAL domain-containing protein [Desulfobulbaceae bacterium]|nr:EAL domain-containing protein [Desulfobulbaceae bacterium]
MKLISLIFVYLGAFLLITALFPTKTLCDQKHHATNAWRFLGALIIIFLIIYGAYGVYLLKSGADLFGLLVAILMFGGGIFVFSVVKLAQVSINKLYIMADKERHRSMHDELTGLPNQNYFHDKIFATITRASNIKNTFVVILIDINRFKEINSSLGHFYGDFLLQEISSRIKDSIRNSDTLARWGGDKFAIILPDTNLKRAVAISNTITENISHSFQIEDNSISVEISNGLAVFPEHGEDVDKLMQSAHIAMYEAQKNHVNYSIFDQKRHHSPFKKMVLASELRDAMNTGALLLFFQPQISVINGKISGVEALLRWQHPEKGLITPDSFIEVIEQTDLSKTLASWVLDKALMHHEEWQKLGLDINVSVNLSIKNLHDYEFPAEVKKLIDKWQINPNRLTLEITESGLMVDPGRVTKVVSELKGAGINLSIDDFGTGYSSLAYLRKFPAREIKIDKSFVLDMLSNEDSAIIVKSTIDLAHNIGRLVVAEGVENHDTYVMLKRFGCDLLQGFLFSKALPADEFIKWHHQYDSNLEKKIPS